MEHCDDLKGRAREAIEVLEVANYGGSHTGAKVSTDTGSNSGANTLTTTEPTMLDAVIIEDNHAGPSSKESAQRITPQLVSDSIAVAMASIQPTSSNPTSASAVLPPTSHLTSAATRILPLRAPIMSTTASLPPPISSTPAA